MAQRVLDVAKLALLREVATHGGVSRAAEVLHTSPSNISQQLRRLERGAGVPLLEPHGRGVRLTPVAEMLVSRTEDVLEILEQAQAELTAARRQRTQTVRLSGFHTFAVGMLGSLIRRLGASHPSVELVFEEREPDAAVEEVLARRADIAIVDEYDGYPMPPARGVVRTPVGREPVMAFLPEAARTSADADWAMEPPMTDAAKWVRGLCHDAGFEPRVRYVSPDPYVHRRLLEEGVAAAFLPKTAAAGLPAGVRPADGLATGLFRSYTLIMRRGTERTVANRAVSASIAAVLADTVETTASPSEG